jgi:hypothetical protein
MNDDNTLVLTAVELAYISGCRIEQTACTCPLYSALFGLFIARLISIK